MSQAIVMEHESEKADDLLEYCRKSSPPPFLLKTYMLVEDPSTDDIISWNADGIAFVVWQPAEFSRDLLPTLFKHSNFSSFVRQLNTYGFRKVTTSRWEFCNDMFKKGGRELLCEIRRRKAWSSKHHPVTTTRTTATVNQEPDEDRGSSSTSSQSTYGSLYDENKRLKRENVVLNSELTNMKRKCNVLLDLVAKYTSSKKNKDEDERPKLFGVRLEVPLMERKKKSVEITENINVLLSQSCK